MSEPKRLLVIDEKNTPYEDFFVQTGWTKVETPSQSKLFSPFEVSQLLEKEYDAILVDYDWLKKQDKDLLTQFRQVGRPFIVIARGNPSDGCEWALGKAASGYIPEDKLLQARDEIIIILKYYQQQLPRQDWLGADHYVKVVTNLLQQPNICFPHWRKFFGERSEKVFHPDALALLGDAKSQELWQFVRSSVILAQEDNADQVEERHLPKRFLLTNHSKEQASIFTDGVAAHTFLEDLNKQLEQKLFSQIAEEMEHTQESLKVALRSHWKEYAKYDPPRWKFVNIYKHFPLRLITFYGPNYTERAQSFIYRNLDALKQDFDTLIYDHRRVATGEYKEESLHEFAQTAEGFIYFFCKDSVMTEFVGTKLVGKGLSSHRKGKPIVFGILFEEGCNWESMIRKKERFLLLNENKVLQDMTEEELKSVTKKINEHLFDIWPA